MTTNQKNVPFPTSSSNLKSLSYSDNVYAWLLVHSYNNKDEYHNYIYKNSFTFKQIAKEIRRTPETVSKRFKALLVEGFLREKKINGEMAYIIPYSNPFKYLDGETVIQLLTLPIEKQKEEMIKVLAFLLQKKEQKRKEGTANFNISAKEILEEFGHSIGNKQSYDRVFFILTILQGAGIVKFKKISYNERTGMPPLTFVYFVSEKGRASDEWLGISSSTTKQ